MLEWMIQNQQHLNNGQPMDPNMMMFNMNQTDMDENKATEGSPDKVPEDAPLEEEMILAEGY